MSKFLIVKYENKTFLELGKKLKNVFLLKFKNGDEGLGFRV
jgi:hypothetical protein